MSSAQTNTGLGAVLMVSCMAIVGLVDNFVSLIGDDAGLWQFHLIRSFLACSVLGTAAWAMGWRIRPRRWAGVLVRSTFGAISMGIYFGALAFLPIAQVGAGLFTAPIFVLVFSVLVFGQPVGVWRVLAAFVGFAGVLLVLRLDFGALSFVTLVPMLAGVTWALTALSTRHLCEGEGTATLLFWFLFALGVLGAIGLIGTVVFGSGDSFVTRGWVTPTPLFWWVTFLQVAGALVAIGMLTRAYQVGEVSYIAVFEYSFLIFAAFWTYVLWGEVLDFWGWIGMVLIIGSGAVIALRTKE